MGGNQQGGFWRAGGTGENMCIYAEIERAYAMCYILYK